jgi:CheY-like chemotaxis protein
MNTAGKLMKADSKKVVAGVSDLFFCSKISATAKQVGVLVEFVGLPQAILDKAAGADLIILDLGQSSLDPLSLIGKLKADPASAHVPVVAFVNHERLDLIEAARQAGCDQVLSRGAFSKELPQLLCGGR